jgi:hypothetical protein
MLETKFYLHSTCGGHSLHSKTNDNEVVNFALGRDLAVTGTWYHY